MTITHKNITYTINDIIKAKRGSYELGDFLGAGGNGTVYECLDLEGNVFAIKFLFNNGKKITKRFEQEIELLKTINNPYIIHYIDDGIINGTDKKNNKANIPFVVMEKADNDLLSYLKNQDTVPYNIYSAQFRGLCNALAELHRYAIHRDIKPENILIKGERWVLSDFGLCEYIDPSKQLDITNENEKIGPQFWISPEAINKYYFGNTENSTIDASSDVYQLCCVFLFVLNHSFPGGGLSLGDINCDIIELKKLLIAGISNKKDFRPQTGLELLDKYNTIIPT